MAQKARSRAKQNTTGKRRIAIVAMYALFALVFAVVVFYTVLHLVFFGFTGEPVGIDLGLALVLPLVWIVGLLRAVKLRARPVASMAWGYGTIAVLVIALALDTVRFGPIFNG
jgi:Na+/alanine symporter